MENRRYELTVCRERTSTYHETQNVPRSECKKHFQTTSLSTRGWLAFQPTLRYSFEFGRLERILAILQSFPHGRTPNRPSKNVRCGDSGIRSCRRNGGPCPDHPRPASAVARSWQETSYRAGTSLDGMALRQCISRENAS